MGSCCFTNSIFPFSDITKQFKVRLKMIPLGQRNIDWLIGWLIDWLFDWLNFTSFARQVYGTSSFTARWGGRRWEVAPSHSLYRDLPLDRAWFLASLALPWTGYMRAWTGYTRICPNRAETCSKEGMVARLSLNMIYTAFNNRRSETFLSLFRMCFDLCCKLNRVL